VTVPVLVAVMGIGPAAANPDTPDLRVWRE